MAVCTVETSSIIVDPSSGSHCLALNAIIFEECPPGNHVESSTLATGIAKVGHGVPVPEEDHG